MQPWSEILIFYVTSSYGALGYSLARITSLNFSNDVPVTFN